MNIFIFFSSSLGGDGGGGRSDGGSSSEGGTGAVGDLQNIMETLLAKNKFNVRVRPTTPTSKEHLLLKRLLFCLMVSWRWWRQWLQHAPRHKNH